ncbi:hypothetical protein A3K86_00070 [Photobacterium jeanii]|uniref:DNA-binding protein n=1 Tax=Photobacterium jeanii TaxID=858640 RepID=A0A178KSB8_9GAMM|nr:PAS domain-containing protein [Photobacterium jeanii]OAN19664.1 hypothetical protein A3K86_00070 [Photobacterium jeanii]PST89860.1 hypothetical protein C9I91_12855 [Photobacterium jeanii]
MLVTLSVSDRLILDAMGNVVDGIAAMYGTHTEVALHSLDIDNPSIIKIANGHVTDRGIGAPITNLALEKLKSGADVSEPYFSRCSKGKLIRSVTTIIRNDLGTAIGLLCINADMDAPIHSFLGTLLPNQLPAAHNHTSPETFAKNPDEMLNDSIERVKNAAMNDDSIPTHKRNRVIVEQLFDNGVFNIKDAIVITAESLNVSRDTVYRYLRDLKNAS